MHKLALERFDLEKKLTKRYLGVIDTAFMDHIFLTGSTDSIHQRA